MFISVVIPLFNKKEYILRAIESVLNQTHSNFELIVVDDGSTDGSAEVVTSVKDDRVRLISQSNQGVSVARNRGVQEARSEWVAFINDFVVDPYLAAADLMVTDMSSVAMEFIPLNKPIIYIDCPAYIDCMFQYLPWVKGTSSDYLRNDPRSNAGRHVGTVVQNLNELVQAVVSERKNPQRLSSQRKEFAEQLLYNPGHGAECAVQEIFRLLEKND